MTPPVLPLRLFVNIAKIATQHLQVGADRRRVVEQRLRRFRIGTNCRRLRPENPGFFKTDLPDMGREENRAFVLETNEKLGVSRAQAEAMLAGSMFGWQTQAADPCSYDEQGRMLTPKQRFQKERGEAR